MSYKRKRKAIVNYCVQEFADKYFVANLVIGRNHPFYMSDNGAIRGLFGRAESDPYMYSEILRGNRRHLWFVCKKKFRNLNFAIIYYYSKNLSKEEFTKLTLERRFMLMTEYIKHKKQQNRSNE